MGREFPDREGKGRQAALEASGQGADMYREQPEWDVTSSCHPTQDTGEGEGYASSHGPGVRSKWGCPRTTGHMVPTQRFCFGAWPLHEAACVSPEGTGAGDK